MMGSSPEVSRDGCRDFWAVSIQHLFEPPQRLQSRAQVRSRRGRKRLSLEFKKTEHVRKVTVSVIRDRRELVTG